MVVFQTRKNSCHFFCAPFEALDIVSNISDFNALDADTYLIRRTQRRPAQITITSSVHNRMSSGEQNNQKNCKNSHSHDETITIKMSE